MKQSAPGHVLSLSHLCSVGGIIVTVIYWHSARRFCDLNNNGVAHCTLLYLIENMLHFITD